MDRPQPSQQRGPTRPASRGRCRDGQRALSGPGPGPPGEGAAGRAESRLRAPQSAQGARTWAALGTSAPGNGGEPSRRRQTEPARRERGPHTACRRGVRRRSQRRAERRTRVRPRPLRRLAMTDGDRSQSRDTSLPGPAPRLLLGPSAYTTLSSPLSPPPPGHAQRYSNTYKRIRQEPFTSPTRRAVFQGEGLQMCARR
ncbi:profilin-4 isoform X1 [Erinaceus europaeus]|uniref:Profilin-4 isoform X1 n=1 Tax=Erinaceus europaeus TaxID=9365 RepID=A0ABM3X1F0_ERIEU|nr:profilin-4 isoform X1 [Erinaceus europaeus]